MVLFAIVLFVLIICVAGYIVDDYEDDPNGENDNDLF